MRIANALPLLGLICIAAIPIRAMYMGGHSEPTYTTHTPEYLSWKDLRSSVKSEAAKAIGKRGKIYIRGTRLFINEPNKGIHVFDNRDPAAPKAIAFIKIPGNLDLAVRGETLFADSFVDLVAIDVSALPDIKEINRQVDVFPYDVNQSAEGEIYYSATEIDRSKGVVIGWKSVKGSK